MHSQMTKIVSWIIKNNLNKILQEAVVICGEVNLKWSILLVNLLIPKILYHRLKKINRKFKKKKKKSNEYEWNFSHLIQ